MGVNWQNLATAVVCNLEFEHLCSRGSFIDESALVRTAVEYVQAATILTVEPELNHDDLPGNQRLDAAARIPGHTNYAFVLEAKWLKSGGGTREWDKEIARDILRLEMLQQGLDVQTDRALLVAGNRSTMTAFRNKTVQTGGGTVAIFSHILQDRIPVGFPPQNQSRIGIRDCDPAVRRFWRRMESQLAVTLPVSYQVALAGHFSATNRADAVEARVWLVRRSRKRSTFQVPAT